ncbi:hypothetical protein KOI40_02170 [Aestuariicella sp. G3-2]|uniref:hypothetical protein n=1 Tax=Pseudomaricurvus albidus TaxID=2842452 RepID=UPI001C0C798A|nr:hypothetical protein [Aestuariicella albida]MBU3068604.1 hypothetical protein [Aestuariicella albida]
MLGISSSVSLNELHKAKPYGKAGSGRSLYANDKLQQTLNGLKGQANSGDHKSYHASAVVNAVNGLRAGTLPANTFLKNGSSNRYCVVHSGFEIEYMIGTPTSQTDIVIVDIRLVEKKVENTKRAGLWSVNQDDQGKWIARDWQPSLQPVSVTGNDESSRIKIGVNGYCEGLQHAAKMLPSHIARGKECELNKLSTTGYQLFYVPQSGNILKAGWQSLAQMSKFRKSKNDVEAAKILSAYMLDAHKKGLYVEWTSHRGGSVVLTEAMKILSEGDKGKPIDLEKKQSVFLSDPTSSLTEADSTRRKINTNITGDQWYNGSKMNMGYMAGAQKFGTAELVCSFTAIREGNKHDKAKRIAKQSTWGMVTTAAGYTLYTKAGALISGGMVASAGWGGLGLALLAVLDNIPALNEDYRSGKLQSTEKLIEKGINKII